MKKYSFFHDESEHSRKINKNTITASNYSDNFISVIIGWCSKDEKDIFSRYMNFEEKYKERKIDGELKSRTIKQKQLTNGFASLSKDNVKFVNDFLDIFNSKTLIYYAVISKIEYIINQLFIGYKNSFLYNMDAMRYSITKAVIMYQPTKIINGLYENPNELITLLKSFFTEQIEKDKRNELLKRMEIEQFKQILILLEDVTPIETIDWNYTIAFNGFKKYLEEKLITNYSLTIDEEGENSNTAKAAEQELLITVTELDSLDSCGIRMADMLAGLISKFLKTLHNTVRYTSEDDQIEKKILNSEWFNISEEQLSLYKKLHNVLVDLNTSWYKAFSGKYSDDLIIFIAFLKFMNHFDSVEAIKSDILMQGEYFNAYACDHLASYYEQMHSEMQIDPLPIDFVIDTSKEYVLNRQGAKVYLDTNKQPLLEISKNKTILNVLSVGFNSDLIPLITTIEENNVNCYLLPMELSEWVMTLVGFANMGENPFPSKVMFTKTNEKLFANIL